MQRAATDRFIIKSLPRSNRLIDPQMELGHPQLYKQISTQIVRGIYSERLLIDLGDKLIGLAEQAYAFRQLETLGELSQALLALPLPAHYTSAARYFRGLELIRRGNLDGAETILETVLGDPPHRYTARALQSLGAVFTVRGDLEAALKLHIEAGSRAAEKGRLDPLTVLFVHRNFALLKSLRGDHRGALVDLEQMVPLAKAIGAYHPPAYYDYLNSLAVELGEMGRVEEAAHTSRIVVSSPFAIAYPEWRQTFDEIATKKPEYSSRSSVAVRDRVGGPLTVDSCVGETTNLLRLPSVKHSTDEQLMDRRPPVVRARVLSFQHWKTIVKSSSRVLPQEVTAEQRSRMTTGEKLIRLMDLISQDETDDETIDRILEAVEQIVPNRRGENLN
jgi:hypothetical protein